MGIFNIALDDVMLYLLDGMFRKIDIQNEMMKMNEMRLKEFEFYQEESQNVEQMRQVRHDFANQLQAAYSMMEDPENADKVKEMIGQMRERLEEK